MNAREVMVFVGATRTGKPRVSTHHMAEDAAQVHAALAVVGISSEPVKEPSDWPTARRERYIAELRKRGFEVAVVDNRKVQ